MVYKQPRPIPYTQDPRGLTVQYGCQYGQKWYSTAVKGSSPVPWPGGMLTQMKFGGHKVDDLQAVCEQGKPFEASSCRAETASAFEFEKSPQV